MRLEVITAKALEKVDGDKYILATAIAKRAEELNKGVAPLVSMDPKKEKPSNIALYEIAEGLLEVNSIS